MPAEVAQYHAYTLLTMGCLQKKKKANNHLTVSVTEKKNENKKSQKKCSPIFAAECAFCSYENYLLPSIQAAFKMWLGTRVSVYV